VTSAELLHVWTAHVATVRRVGMGDRDAVAVENMEMFSIAEAQDAGVANAELAGFLRDAHRAYSAAASRAEFDGWFYAWHDHQAGQLRMSACPIASVSELLFRCAIALVMILWPSLRMYLRAMSRTASHGRPW